MRKRHDTIHLYSSEIRIISKASMGDIVIVGTLCSASVYVSPPFLVTNLLIDEKAGASLVAPLLIS